MFNPLAVLVVGPESTGTRLLTRILIEAGCAGSDQHFQPWDTELPRPHEHPAIVWRRSVPHGGQWPFIKQMHAELAARGYAVQTLVTSRLSRPCMDSQFEERHVQAPGQSVANLQRAYRYIFGPVGVQDPYEVVPYEAVIHHGVIAVHRFLDAHGLKTPLHLNSELFNGNAKWLLED